MLTFIAVFSQTTTLSFSLFELEREGCRATRLPDSITELLTPSYDCVGNDAIGRIQDPYTFVPHQTPDCKPSSYIKPLDSLWKGGPQSLRSEPTVFASSTGWGLKAPFYFLQTFFVFLFSFCGQRKLRFWWATEAVTDFIVLGSKITADIDCSHEIKRCLLLGRKAMNNLDSILKCRDITLLMKVPLVKAMVFPVVMYRCESWTIKKAECQRIVALKLWC